MGNGDEASSSTINLIADLCSQIHHIAKISASKLETDKALMSQLVNYKENQDTYNIPYGPSLIIPYASSLKEENSDINANEGLPEPYILIIQNTMDL
nr:3269_t:CDS:2 [Entrophospora candida]